MEQNTASRREVWLSIALAVAKGLPEPERLGLQDDDAAIVSMTLPTHDGVRQWATHLGLGECEANPLDGSLWAPHCRRDGWSWQIRANGRPSVAAESSLAEQVVSAIPAPDADAPYRCQGCGKTSRIVAHRPGCPVERAWDERHAAERVLS